MNETQFRSLIFVSIVVLAIGPAIVRHCFVYRQYTGLI